MKCDWQDLPAAGEFPDIPFTSAAASGAGQSHSPGVQVLLPAELFGRIRAHVCSDTTRETMGLLFGRAYLDPAAGRLGVTLDDAFAVEQANATAESVVMLKSAWSSLWKSRPQQNDLRLVGWYHSHPNYGVMLSATDRNTQQTWFPRPWQIALVLDPIRGETAAYAGRESAVADLILAGDPPAGTEKET